MYKAMSEFYDKLTYDVNYDEIVKFYSEVIKLNKFNPRSILELGCGTGNVTSRLNSYSVFAIDLSEEMLGIANEKLSKKRNIRFFNMDMRSFKFNKKFDLVISSLDSINYITDINDLKKVIKNVFEHLKQNSMFIFDVNSEYKITKILGNNTFTDEKDDTLYIWQASFDESSRISDYLITFFIERDDGLYERFSESQKERAYSTDELKNLLISVGFKSVDIYDGFTLNEHNEESERLSFVAIKGESYE